MGDAPRRLPAFHHFLQHLPIPERVHCPPESIVFVGHQPPLPDQAVERLENQLFPVADVIEYLAAEDEVAPIYPDFGLVAHTEIAHRILVIELDEVKVEWRPGRDEAADRLAVLEALYHVRQWRIGQTIAVIGEEDFFVSHEMFHRHQAFADIAPDSRVDQRDAPIRRRFPDDFHLLSEIRNNAIITGRLIVAQKIIFDDIRLIAETEDEIPMAVLAVVLHDVPQDRLVADGDHRLWNILRVVADARAKPTTEQHNLHDASSRGSITSILGIGTMNLQPQSPTCRILVTISSFKFQGKIRR